MLASVFSLTVISVNRFLGINYPDSNLCCHLRRKWSVLAIIGLIWVSQTRSRPLNLQLGNCIRIAYFFLSGASVLLFEKQQFINDIGNAYENIGFVALKGHFLEDILA